MSKVYLVHVVTNGDGLPRNDTKDAARFGEVIVCFNYPPVATPEGMAKMVEEGRNALQETLHKYTKDDYLVFMGDPALIACAGAIAVRATGGFVRWLIYNRKENAYYEHPVFDFYSDSEEME